MDPLQTMVAITDILFGLTVIGIGIFLIIKTLNKLRKNYLGFLMVPAGVILLIVGLVSKFGDNYASRKATGGSVLCYAMIFTVAGLTLVLNSIAIVNYRKKHCTREVFATVIDIKKNVSTSRDDGVYREYVSYTPTLEIDHCGEKKTLNTKNFNAKTDFPRIGGTMLIYVDPESAEDYYIESPSEGMKPRIIFGAIMTGVSTLIILIGLLALYSH
ncbi:MAG: hypothetical protein J6U54_18975 [Clostridiales bacterium]|nr:hypothetical protein [Clostridiales bacterium]